MQGNVMLSEELLLEVPGIDPETTLAELIGIVDEHCRKHQQKGIREQWENLADVAFLAFIHKKPRAFKTAVEAMAAIFAGFSISKHADALGWGNCGRAAVLICSDAPTDPAVITFMLGHLKGALGAAREFCERLEEPEREKIERRSQEIMQLRIPNFASVAA